MNPILLRTQRLILRELKENDWMGIFEYSKDPEVVRYQEWGPYSENDTKKYLRSVISSQKEHPRIHYDLAVVLTSNSQTIGSCGIHISSLPNREGWIGYFLNRKFWNQGYATETTRALLEFGFKGIKLHRIYATCAPANLRSERVLRKLGMKHEGCLRDHKLVRGQWRDSLMYSIIDREW